MRTIAVIPAYNEETTLADVLKKARDFVDEIIVVDDGSSDATASIAARGGATVARHAINRGLGAAIGTGFAAAYKRGADVIITLDADGQHNPEEIPMFIEEIEQGADAVIGSRMLIGEGMPWHRKIAQHIGNLATFVLFGARVSDSQSGYRAFTREAIEQMDIKTNHMEVSSELIAEIAHNDLALSEVPIEVIYTEYSLSKGQNVFLGIKTLIKLVIRRLNG
jgi:glycosyltransferase involved in cell wall biosynthesis